jgi:hypothetical protein
VEWITDLQSRERGVLSQLGKSGMLAEQCGVKFQRTKRRTDEIEARVGFVACRWLAAFVIVGRVPCGVRLSLPTLKYVFAQAADRGSAG